MRILLFGGSGQLGFEIQKRADALNFEVVSPVTKEVNIYDRDQVMFLTREFQPNLVINSAAYTAVDLAEEEEQQAYRVNCEGAAHVAEAALETGCRLFHISTDYVFGDGFDSPILESAPTQPLNVYGASKLAGEQRVREILSGEAVIIRTSSLFGSKRDNIVQTFIKLFQEREEIRIVSDQYMAPTWAGWLAEVLLDLGRIECKGVIHACSGEAVSWFDFASAIYAQIEPALGLSSPRILKPVSSNEFPRPARRPSYSVMSTERLRKLLGRKPMPWREGLRAHLREIGYEC